MRDTGFQHLAVEPGHRAEPWMTRQSRRVLSDARDARGAGKNQRDAVIVVGAQAILLRGGRAHVIIAESTKHSDLVVDPRGLSLLFC
jgi:hypothetical protein